MCYNLPLKTSRRIRFYAYAWIGILVCSSVFAQEGTKQLMPNPSSPCYLELYDQSDFASYRAEDRERLYIRLKAGEKMYFGMKMLDYDPPTANNPSDGNRTTFRIKSPTGTIVYPQTAFPLIGDVGFIDTYTAAVSGPNGAILNGTPISTGYQPLVYTATVEGDYYIEFETWNNVNAGRTVFSGLTKRRSWIEFFDVTVTDGANNVVTNPVNANLSAGRLWSKQWALTNVSFTTNALQSFFYVYTADGFVNRVKYEMITFSFLFVSNSYGVRQTADAFENRRSIINNAFTLDVSEHKIFLNDPDVTVYPSSTIRPKLKIWFETVQIYDFDADRSPNELMLNPGVINFTKNDPTCPHENMALFRVESSIAGQVQLLLDIDGGGFTAGGVDRALYANVSPGLNYVPWDLRDGLGNVHQGGTFNAKSIFLLAGVTHFPLYDVESMLGVTTEAVRPFQRLNPTLYWDDTNLDSPPTSTLTVAVGSGKVQLSNPSASVRKWNYNGQNAVNNNGNRNTMNSWFTGLELGADFQYSIAQGTVCKNNDHDQDEVPDVIDIDDDNDGLPDLTECPGTVDPSTDDDNDNVFNYKDTQIAGFIDTNSDNVNDNFDRDKDGIPDFWDLDSDNDGLLDVTEGGGIDSDTDGIIGAGTITDFDKDGLDDSVDPNVPQSSNGTPLANPDTDGDGIPNAEDADSDNDGIPDNREGQSTPAYITPLTVGNTDLDKDGLNDAYDAFHNQYTETPPYGNYGDAISGGNSLLPFNFDAIDQPDYIEADSDNDGIPDWVEGFDDNENGSTLEDLSTRSASYESTNGNPGHYPATDNNGNGLPDWIDGTPPDFLRFGSIYYKDTDQDGLIDLYDSNQNGKGYGLGIGAFAEPDNDNDGNPNYRDIQDMPCLPILTFAGATSTCVGGMITLTANDPNATNYTWRRGATIIGNQRTLTLNNVTTTNAGTDYSLQITNGTCSGTSAPFAVSVQNSPDLTFTGATTVCSGESITLTANQAGATSYIWRKGSMVIGNTRTLTLNNPTISEVGNDFTLEIDNNGCRTVSGNFTIGLVSPPDLTFTGAGLLCIGDNLILTANQNNAISYTWKKGGISIATGRTLTINNLTVSNTGDDYSLEVNNGTCTRESQPFTITVVSAPLLTFSGNTTVCINDNLTLTATQVNAASYTWRKGNVVVGETNPLIINNISQNEGGSDYTLEINNGTCIRTSAPFTVNVLANPDFSFAGAVSACLGEDISLTANFATGTAYTWRKGAAVVSNQQTLTISDLQATNAGNDYTLEINNGICSRTSNPFIISVLSPPDLTFTGAATVCTGDEVSLTANQANAVSYTWRKGGVILAGTRTLTITSADDLDTGSDYTLEVNNGNCSRESAAFSMQVVSTPDLTFDGSTTACIGGTITLNANHNSGTYTWRKGNTVIGTNQTLTLSNVSTENAGNDYTLSVNSGTCTRTSAAFVVSVVALPDLTFSGTTSLCTGSTLLLTANQSTAQSYIWKKGGVVIGTDKTLTINNITGADTGSNYTLEIHNGTCTTESQAFAVNVVNPPELTFSGNTSACIGDDILLTATQANAVSYAWRRNGVLLSSSRVLILQNVTPANSGNDYTLEINNGTCTRTSGAFGINITIPPTPAVSIENPNGVICVGSQGTFRAIATLGGDTPSFIWLLNGTPIGTDNSQLTYTGFKEGDKLEVVMISSLACTESVRAEVQITVGSLPTIQIQAEATEYGYACPVILRATGGISYTWTPADDIRQVYAQGDSVLIETLQTRTYIVTGTDANGCVDKDTITITVRDMEDIFIPSLFSPNQDGANANETFKVHGKGIAEIKLQVFDRAGNLVYETTDLAQATKIGWDGKKNGIDQPSSMYIWQIAGKFRNGKILQYKGKTKGKVNLFR